MSANTTPDLAGPLTMTEQPGYDLDLWLDESSQPDLVGPAATALLVLLLLAALVAGAVLLIV